MNLRNSLCQFTVGTMSQTWLWSLKFQIHLKQFYDNSENE